MTMENGMPNEQEIPKEPRTKIPPSFLVMGGLSVLTMAGAVLYTIFFYLTLPDHHTLDSSDLSVRHVPMPVPPTTFLPSGKGAAVLLFRSPDFSLRVATLSKKPEGFDLTLSLLDRTGGTNGSLLSFSLLGLPRWVDANRSSGLGRGSLDSRILFRKGTPGTFTLHFPVRPSTSSFDIYLGLVGVRGVRGTRYQIHFANLSFSGTAS